MDCLGGSLPKRRGPNPSAGKSARQQLTLGRGVCEMDATLDPIHASAASSQTAPKLSWAGAATTYETELMWRAGGAASWHTQHTAAPQQTRIDAKRSAPGHISGPLRTIFPRA